MDNHSSKNSFSEHLLEYRTVEKKRLLISFLVTSLVMVLEVVGGLLTNSIALISDAGHMFTHSFAIAISLIAVYIARKPVCHHKTFGLFRAEILAAFINGLFLLLMIKTLKSDKTYLNLLH
jgi:cobalt-zinc-cadmium efflux system protein